MEKKKEAYATEDPTDTSAEKQEEMAKEAIKQAEIFVHKIRTDVHKIRTK